MPFIEINTTTEAMITQYFDVCHSIVVCTEEGRNDIGSFIEKKSELAVNILNEILGVR